MFATLKERLGNIVSGARRRRRSANREFDDDSYEKPRVLIANRPPLESTKSRWFVPKASTGPRNHPNSTTDSAEDDDNSLPLLFFLARSWAWEAVTFRCTTHPNEVDVQYRDAHGDTCLHWVAFGRPPVSTVQALLSACPALARTANDAGTLPLHVACSYRASPSVIQEILLHYPEAAAIPDGNGATPMHHLCDYGSGDPWDSVSSIRVLLRCPYGVQSVLMKDRRYQRRPLYIINARKNLREQERYIELLRDRRRRQRAIEQEMGWADWNHDLQAELLDRFEDDIRSSHQENSMWIMASLLVLAEYSLRCSAQPLGKSHAEENDCSIGRAVHCSIIDRYFGSDDKNSTSEAMEDNNSVVLSQESKIENDFAEFGKDESGSPDDVSTRIGSRLPSLESVMLIAFITSRDCPPALLEYAILLSEKELLIADPACGQQLPLHVAASMYNETTANEGSAETVSHLLTLLLEGGPEAASIRDAKGAFPLNSILQHSNGRHEASKTYWSNGLHKLIEANPLALLESDAFTKNPLLWSQGLSLLRQNANAIYTIFRANPTVLFQGI